MLVSSPNLINITQGAIILKSSFKMADASRLKKIACEAIDNHAQALRQINRKIWEKPELSFKESFAHDVLTGFLESEGFQVTRKWTLETAFGGQSGGDSGPCIGVISEYDALPEVGHACGHNLIAESGIAAAIGIKAALAATDNKLGRVRVLGTPAEEGGGGKVLMIKNGCFKDVDFCMMVHPCPTDSTVPSVLARETAFVTYKGYAAHAAAFPWEGINALDAAVMAYNSVSAMRQQMKPTWRVHGVICEGGVKPNIIPDKTRLEFFFRAPTDGEIDELKQKLAGCFEGAAKATGCTADIEFGNSQYYSNLESNPTMASLYQKNAETLGIQFPSLAEQKAKVLGSTDMGNVSHVIPSIHPIYSIDSMAVNHSYAFTAAAGTDVAHDKTLIAAKAMAMTAVDLFCSQDLREQAKQEFTKAHSK
ncbi:peptidase M20 domain-containing protein 2-like [Actinia tenebrosa]|uniref:Peptidase M20 domain-containing protein 2 n=1 Tax=Actinia tenebrosa TaxID=6105 RepID=A0A6P8J507_ACTTE|nr:peptidase M20 domain-containing protein 2-like [Actinia tenebrosa]